MSSLTFSPLEIIPAGREIAARKQAAAQIARAYQNWKSGKCRQAIFLIPPEADLLTSAREISDLGGVPLETGVLLRTSGSTSGQGKIVALSWEALEASARATHAYLGGAGAWVNTLPLYHIAGFQTIFRSIFAGYEPIIGDFQNLAEVLTAIRQSCAPRHYLAQVPTQLARFVRQAECEISAGSFPSKTDFADSSDLPSFHTAPNFACTTSSNNTCEATINTASRNESGKFPVLEHSVSQPAAVSRPDLSSCSELRRQNEPFFRRAPHTSFISPLQPDPKLDAILVGGSAIHPDLLAAAKALQIRIVTSYGMTETCGGCVYDGFALNGVQLSLSAQGQISIGGEITALGYLGHPQNNEFTSDTRGVRWHHTRDWGEITQDGLRVYGRIDEAITTGGLTVIPQLVEAEIESRFGVPCIIVGVPSNIWGEVAVAVSAKPLPLSEVQAFLNTRFERGWVPRRFYSLTEILPTQHLPAFPLTSSEKIDRRRLAILVREKIAGESDLIA